MSLGSAFLAVALVAAGNPYLDEGEQAYRAHNYERAISRLILAKGVSSTSADERQQILELLARAYAAVGKLEAAEDSYAELLAHDPHSAAPQDVAPKLRAAFQRAKERLFPPEHVRMRLLPSPAGRADLWVEDPWSQVAALRVVGDVPEGAEPFTLTAPVNEHVARCDLPEGAHFHVEALGANGDVVARLGSADAPLTATAPSAPPERVPTPAPAPAPAPLPAPVVEEAPAPTDGLSRGWPVALGVLAVGAVAATFALVASSRNDSGAAWHTMFGSDTRALNDSARAKAFGAYGTAGLALVAGVFAVVLALRW